MGLFKLGTHSTTAAESQDGMLTVDFSLASWLVDRLHPWASCSDNIRSCSGPGSLATQPLQGKCIPTFKKTLSASLVPGTVLGSVGAGAERVRRG